MSPVWFAAAVGLVLLALAAMVRRGVEMRSTGAGADGAAPLESDMALFAPGAISLWADGEPKASLGSHGSLIVVSPPTRPAPREAPAHEEELNPRTSRPWYSPRRWATPTEGKILFWVSFAVYIAAAAVLILDFKSSVGDAESRLANGFYVLFSRDPHMAAVGFVWNPLPSWLEMVPLLFKGWFPWLSKDFFAAFIVSALAMAGAVVELHRLLSEFGVGPAVRRTLTILFALQPMIFYYGANGQSEALEMYLLLVATRYLARWVRTRSPLSLVASGLALAFVYLARIEGAFAAAGGAVVVVVVSVASRRRPRSLVEAGDGARSTLADLAVFLGPFVFVFVGWAGVSWLIVGHPFEYISSQYGNSSQLAVSGITTYIKGYERYRLIVLAVLSMAPALPVVLPIALARAFRQRDLSVFAPLSLLGGVLAFTILGTAAGQTFGWYRIYIMIIPLAALLFGIAVSGWRKRSPSFSRRADDRSSGRRTALAQRVFALASVVACVGLVLPSYATTVWAIHSPKIGREDLQHLGYVFNPHSTQADQYKLAVVRRESHSLDELHLRSGSIIVDTFVPCVPYLYVLVDHPKIFVITNDRDFQPALADPTTYRVQYFLVDDPASDSLDAVNQAYPTLFTTGAGIATVVMDWPAAGTCPHLRLLRITS